MIYHKHPIRSLLTSMLRKASIRYSSDVYALSFEKYKGEFLKDKKCIVMYTTDEQKTKYLQHFINKHDTIWKLNRDIPVHFICILHLLNNTCVKHNFKSVHVSNLFWSRGLIHVLAHFQRTCSQIYFRFSPSLLRKPHLFVILTAIGWFIINIQSDLFWHQCLERQAFDISCVFAFFTLWKRVKTHVLSDQSVHITHTYCSVSKLSKFGAYLYSRVHNNPPPPPPNQYCYKTLLAKTYGVIIACDIYNNLVIIFNMYCQR
jgi:hypothetical protein